MLSDWNHILKHIALVLVVPWASVPTAAQMSDPGTGRGQGSASLSAQISCSPDTPITTIDSDVLVRVFVDLPQDQKLQYVWTATAGKIQGNNFEARWSLKGALSGKYQATVAVSRSGTKLADCSVSVLVVEPLRAGPSPPPPTGQTPKVRETARGFLVKGHKEQAGYGLYSYFLMGSPPTESSRARCLAGIQAYLKLIPTVGDLEDYVSADKLNVTYLPVKAPVPLELTAEWALENYDFGRARVLLDLLPGVHNTGPYIVSVLKPMGAGERLSSQYLFQDLSAVPTEPQDLMSMWILEFVNLAAQERFWEPRTAELLTLKLRTTISVLASGLPEVKKQLASWVSWTG
jgi:hypothetical protein